MQCIGTAWTEQAMYTWTLMHFLGNSVVDTNHHVAGKDMCVGFFVFRDFKAELKAGNPSLSLYMQCCGDVSQHLHTPHTPRTSGRTADLPIFLRSPAFLCSSSLGMNNVMLPT
jgi:hypothetical protein